MKSFFEKIKAFKFEKSGHLSILQKGAGSMAGSSNEWKIQSISERPHNASTHSSYSMISSQPLHTQPSRCKLNWKLVVLSEVIMQML